jgi:hypothetical protein
MAAPVIRTEGALVVILEASSSFWRRVPVVILKANAEEYFLRIIEQGRMRQVCCLMLFSARDSFETHTQKEHPMPALPGKVALVIGNGTPEHRAVTVALAESGALVAVAGNPGTAEVLLHSIANEIWAIGPRSTVAGIIADNPGSFAAAAIKAKDELGGLDLVVRVESVLSA